MTDNNSYADMVLHTVASLFRLSLRGLLLCQELTIIVGGLLTSIRESLKPLVGEGLLICLCVPYCI